MKQATTTLWCSAVIVLATFGCLAHEPRWPAPVTDPVTLQRETSLEARVEAQPVCIGARKWSAGTLGDSVLYRVRRVGKELHVGYFVYWSTERPWGDNVLSYTVVPALIVDAFYSHFLWVLPGLKDVIHGRGDVEGATVVFEVRDDGSLEPVRGVADDGTHDAVELTREDLKDARGRVILATGVWSHQLGEHGGAALANENRIELRCFQHESLKPLTPEVVQAFRLERSGAPRRALPAWPTPDHRRERQEPATPHDPVERVARAR